MRTTQPPPSQGQPPAGLIEEAAADPLLTPGEVASMFRVDPKTVTRWAQTGKLTSVKTLGGHRRFKESEVRRLLRGVSENAA